MNSWLRAAEDLLEVVDRKAKRVVGSDEQSDSQPSVSNGPGIQARRPKPKEVISRLSSAETTQSIKSEQEQKRIAPNAKTDKVDDTQFENSLNHDTNHTAEVSTELPSDTNKNTSGSDFGSSADTQTEGGNDTNSAIEVPVTENNIEITTSSTSNDIGTANSNDVHEESSSSSVMGKETETVKGDHLHSANPEIDPSNDDTSVANDQPMPDPEVKRGSISNSQENERVHLAESLPNINKEEPRTNTPSMKVQDQLDEAQGLLKSAISTGQSKEARLAKVCAGLSSRLQEYKSENAQLEELLVAERERCNLYEARIKQLQQTLSASKIEASRAESNMAEVLAAKNSEIESLVGSIDSLKKQAAASEEKLASLQANTETIMRSRELTETRMMQALREELTSAERRAEEEHAAHNATKMAAVEREVELEHRAIDASNALARLQRTAEESSSRAMELEHKVALLEIECATLTQELQDMEAHTRRGQKKASEEANQILQMQAWQEEVERAHQGQRDAENKLSSLEAELQKMRVEMAGMRRDAEHYSRQEHMELEKRYRELTDLLYHKQTQLEAMASEKAAIEFQLEKEIKRSQEAQVEAERSKALRRTSTLWEEEADIKALEPLPLHHRHMVGATIQLQKAAKLLDSGAVRATRFLWRYPVARVALLCYLVFVHFFLMYLLHRLQEQADDLSSRDFVASMGLGNSSMP